MERIRIVIAALLIFITLPARAQEAQPGDSCAGFGGGASLWAGGPEIDGGHLLVCDGGNWVSILAYADGGGILTQVAFDTAACTAVKDGRIRYNSAGATKFEYCDGAAGSWKSIKQPQCADDDTGVCYVAAIRTQSDADFTAANIVNGINILGVTGTCCSGSAGFQKVWSELQKLTASDAEDGDNFGGNVAIDGDAAVIGAVSEDGTGIRHGAAYVFERASDGGWSEVQKLTASDAADHDFFGGEVAIDGDAILIGAAGEDGAGVNRGAVYVFERASDGNWTQVQKLTASDGEDSDLFGGSVRVNGDTAVIGAYLEDGAGSNRGAAYIFERASDGNWTQVQKLTASDAADSANFSFSVAIDGDVAVIGAHNEDGAGWERGAVYVFERASDGSWSELQKLTASDADDEHYFGYTVAVDGDAVLIGAIGNGSAVYVFERGDAGNWSEVQKLTPGGNLGRSVAIDGDTAVLGADLADGAGTDRGTAYVFKRESDGSWTQIAELTAGDAADDDRFGMVGISGNTAVIGAHREDGGGVADRGAAYLFYLDILTDNPYAFDFIDQEGVATSTLYESNIMRISVMDGTSVTIGGDDTPEYRICSDDNCSTVTHDWSGAAGTIDDGEYLQLRMTSPAATNTVHTASILVGAGSDVWSLDTTPCDNTPDAFNFTDMTTDDPATIVNSSDIIQITGIDCSSVSVSISGDDAPKFRVCADAACSSASAFTATGSVSNNEYLQLQMTSPSSPPATHTATVTIGTASDEWSVNTVPKKRVFVSSASYTGNAVGGVANAHALCQGLADAVPLGGTWKAWIADTNAASGPDQHFSNTTGTIGYQLTDGTIVADDWGDLTDGTLDAPINRDENQSQISGSSNVWTNVTSAGARDGTNSNQNTCSAWTSGASSRNGFTGGSGLASSSWTQTGSNLSCDTARRLYCFEQ